MIDYVDIFMAVMTTLAQTDFALETRKNPIPLTMTLHFASLHVGTWSAPSGHRHHRLNK
jgi:hypothetical protein